VLIVDAYWRDTINDEAEKENASGQHSQPYPLGTTRGIQPIYGRA